MSFTYSKKRSNAICMSFEAVMRKWKTLYCLYSTSHPLGKVLFSSISLIFPVPRLFYHAYFSSDPGTPLGNGARAIIKIKLVTKLFRDGSCINLSHLGLVIYNPSVGGGGGRIQYDMTNILNPPHRARQFFLTPLI